MDKVLPAAGIIGLFTSSGVVLMQLIRNNTRLNKNYKEDIDDLREENKSCRRRLNLMIDAFRDAGFQVPKDIWE